MMKMKNYIIASVLLLVTGIFFVFGVSALTIQEDTIYFLDTNNWGEPYIYMYSNNNGEAFTWQNDAGKMTYTKTVGSYKLYSYKVSSSYKNKFDMVVFSSKNGKQTKDLYYVRTGTMFVTNTSAIGDGTDYGKYDGQWYVYDKSELETLIEKANNADSTKYTATSYNALKTPLEAANKALSQTYGSAATDVLVSWDGVTPYDTIVANLKTAVDGLELKNKVNVAVTTDGSITINQEWYEDNELVEFTVKPLDGYEIKNITVTKVTGYNDDGEPILSADSDDITVTENFDYSYTLGTDDIYINAEFVKKKYTITTTIGDLNAGNIEPTGPIAIEHGDNQEFIITANEGWVVKNVIVNGEDHSLTDGKLTLTNVTQDMTVVVQFEIKTYVIKIDGVDYQMPHGSKITELANYDNLIVKENYTFNGFLIKGTDKYFDVDTEIKEEIELTTSFTEIKQEEPEEDKDVTDDKDEKPEEDKDVTDDKEEESNLGSNDKIVPNTGDSIIYTFIALVVSVITILGLLVYRKKKIN